MALVRTDKEGLVRDTGTRAILNADVSSLEAYKKQRTKAREFEELKARVEHFDAHNRRIDKIETDIDTIKLTLKQILEKIDDGSSS